MKRIILSLLFVFSPSLYALEQSEIKKCDFKDDAMIESVESIAQFEIYYKKRVKKSVHANVFSEQLKLFPKLARALKEQAKTCEELEDDLSELIEMYTIISCQMLG